MASLPQRGLNSMGKNIASEAGNLQEKTLTYLNISITWGAQRWDNVVFVPLDLDITSYSFHFTTLSDHAAFVLIYKQSTTLNHYSLKD